MEVVEIHLPYLPLKDFQVEIVNVDPQPRVIRDQVVEVQQRLELMEPQPVQLLQQQVQVEQELLI